MWHDLLTALALLLVIEGIFPFLNPKGMRKMMAMMAQMDDRSLRVAGLISMVVGALALSFIR